MNNSDIENGLIQQTINELKETKSPNPERRRMLEALISSLQKQQKWQEIIDLREDLSEFITSETFGNLPVFIEIAHAAIRACEEINNKLKCARYLHDEGHRQHRSNYHQKAIESFEKSKEYFDSLEANFEFQALESLYMQALCYRALREQDRAMEILDKVLSKIDDSEPWRAHPLNVMAWIYQDKNQIQEAEGKLQTVVQIHEEHEGEKSYILIQVLADLGEVQGILKKYEIAEGTFQRSLQIANQHLPHSKRQIGRTTFKYAQMETTRGRFEEAMTLLKDAESKIVHGANQDYFLRIKALQGLIFLRQGRFKAAYSMFRVVYRLRRHLNMEIFKPLMNFVWRYITGRGFPR